jgi:hypothetical protein
VPRLKTSGMQHIPAPCQSYAGLWFTAPWLHFEPRCLNCERPRPFKAPCRASTAESEADPSFDFNVDPDRALHSDADPDPASQSDANSDPLHCTG